MGYKIGESVRTKAERIMIKNARNIIPVRESVGIYFLLKNQEIVYVGQSKSVYQRIDSHRSDPSKDFDFACFFECRSEELDEIERTLIQAFNPKYNKVHKLFSGYLPYEERSPRDVKLAESLARRISEGKFNKNTIRALKDFRFTTSEDRINELRNPESSTRSR